MRADHQPVARRAVDYRGADADECPGSDLHAPGDGATRRDRRMVADRNVVGKRAVEIDDDAAVQADVPGATVNTVRP